MKGSEIYRRAAERIIYEGDVELLIPGGSNIYSCTAVLEESERGNQYEDDWLADLYAAYFSPMSSPREKLGGPWLSGGSLNPTERFYFRRTALLLMAEIAETEGL
jgi:hypothetical protein